MGTGGWMVGSDAGGGARAGISRLLTHSGICGLYLHSKGKPLTCFKERLDDMVKVTF